MIKRRTPETKRQKQVRQGKAVGGKKKKEKIAKSEESGDIGSRRRNYALRKTNLKTILKIKKLEKINKNKKKRSRIFF